MQVPESVQATSPARLRVLHVIPSMARSSGGPAHAMRAMETALTQLGCDVVTATTDDDGPDGRIARGASRARTGARREVFAMTTRAYKTSRGLWRYLRAHAAEFDVIHAHGLFSFAPLAAAWWARRRGVPYVMRPLGVLNRYGRLGRKRRAKALSLRWIEGPLLRDAAAVQFTAEQERAEAADCGIALRAVVLPLGIDRVCHGSSAQPRAHRGRELLYMSRIDPKKNLEACIDAMAALPEGFGDVRLRICGAGDAAYVQALRGRADAAGVADRITWSGQVSGQDKAAAFAQADAFVLPSYSENFGIAAAEALSCGLPCLLAEGVALSTDVREAEAGVVTGTDAASIAAGIVELLRDARRLQERGHAARVLWQTRFSMKVMGERLLALYRSLPAARCRP